MQTNVRIWGSTPLLPKVLVLTLVLAWYTTVTTDLGPWIGELLWQLSQSISRWSAALQGDYCSIEASLKSLLHEGCHTPGSMWHGRCLWYVGRAGHINRSRPMHFALILTGFWPLPQTADVNTCNPFGNVVCRKGFCRYTICLFYFIQLITLTFF